MAEASGSGRVLLTTDAVGGVWTYTLDLAHAMSRAGVEVVVAVLGPAPSDAALAGARALPGLNVVLTGLPLDWLAPSPAEVRASGRRLAELARARHCGLVQLHAPALAAGARFGVPVVSVHHSCLATWWAAVHPGEEMPEDFRWRTALAGEGLAASDAVVTPSTAMAHAVADAYRLSTPPLAIRNGRAAAGTVRSDAPRRAPFVLTSGRLWDEGKNIAMLDRAAARLAVPVMAAGATKGPQGEEPQFSALRLLGSLGGEEMRRWLSQAPVFASAARYEPFGLGVLEAAQAGCALVLADIPSFRELWGGACLFVPADDDAAMADALTRLLGDLSLLNRLSERAQHRARLYTAAAMATETMRLHTSLLALARIGRGAAA